MRRAVRRLPVVTTILIPVTLGACMGPSFNVRSRAAPDEFQNLSPAIAAMAMNVVHPVGA
jgi:hypothetical protein